jgi:hypothetical protein
MGLPACARRASSNIGSKARLIDLTELPTPAAAAGVLIPDRFARDSDNGSNARYAHFRLLLTGR